ncbi:hypothetical protein M430DRAFT_15700 [Amorphotheca resinae ATCC 22711]|uniref:Uncharacterized protein n=1 Tax=Amorphotheca resinae ATCC 22711 TaxID=857342 RepID=A0A2T3B9D6_AMORE|nr:hypothetical protein M430DRAFT_15700 [Amorphotheca resinae ATCC 22711]PSS24945.1 hypothetical protein M430DRAFT_15700 [Amorphotheca resinae ATCC 22711]
MALSFLDSGAFAAQSMAIMPYNGLQTLIFSSDLSTTCDASLNTSIGCPEDIIQVTTYGIQAAGWRTSSLASLCTSACEASLAELATAVEAGCGSAMVTINTQNITFSSRIDYIYHKVDLICLADTDTSDLCSDVERRSWNITEMVPNEAATWLNNTPFDLEWSDATGAAGSTQLAALDYYIERGDPIDDDNYG